MEQHIQQQLEKPIIIAGPCSVEGRRQILTSAQEARKAGIKILRASLWKPRTESGTFRGVARETDEWKKWYKEIESMGLIPATEVMMPEDAQAVINATHGPVVLWLGARNQNDEIQMQIGQIIKDHPRVMLMIKNPTSPDEKHWKGIVSHVLAGGASKDQLLLCHRGFSPATNGNRNNPDLEMALRVKECTGIPMLIDPSHITGNRRKVIPFTQEAMQYRNANGTGFDGMIIEVHPNPEKAWTDAPQQISWREFARALPRLRRRQ